MVGWHHRNNGLEFEQTLKDSEGQASLACCSPWGHRESDVAERLNSKRSTCGSISCMSYRFCFSGEHWLAGRRLQAHCLITVQAGL